jgi:hypothetical protein
MRRRNLFFLILDQAVSTVVAFVISRYQTWTGTYSRKVLVHNSQVCFIDEYPATGDTVNMKTEVKVA